MYEWEVAVILSTGLHQVNMSTLLMHSNRLWTVFKFKSSTGGEVDNQADFKMNLHTIMQ